MPDRRPRIGICTALEQARWTVWDQQAYLLNRSYVDAIQAAGGLALMLPPDSRSVEEPDGVLDVLDGLILAGGADIDPASYGEEAARRDHGHLAGARHLSRSRSRGARSSATSRCWASAAACS